MPCSKTQMMQAYGLGMLASGGVITAALLYRNYLDQLARTMVDGWFSSTLLPWQLVGTNAAFIQTACTSIAEIPHSK